MFTRLLYFVSILLITPNALSADNFKFTGYTDMMVVGDVGYTGLTGACRAEFGRKARTCTTKEFILSPKITAPTGSNAWIQPYAVFHSGETSLDFSLNSAKNCDAWRKTNVGGLVVNTQGQLLVDVCDVQNRVTCCRP